MDYFCNNFYKIFSYIISIYILYMFSKAFLFNVSFYSFYVFRCNNWMKLANTIYYWINIQRIQCLMPITALYTCIISFS